MNDNELEFLELSIHKRIKTRITREYKELTNIYMNDKNDRQNNVSLIYDDELKIYKITIIENLDDGIKNVYIFTFDSNYPFYSPKFQFNNEPYSHYLKIPSERFSEHLKKFTNKSCLCCSSLICKNNWSPAITFKMFINELNRVKKYKRNVVYKMLSDQIKNKYLIDDIEIDAFLFA
jgi:ubiquitin-protein ligase